MLFFWNMLWSPDRRPKNATKKIVIFFDRPPKKKSSFFLIDPPKKIVIFFDRPPKKNEKNEKPQKNPPYYPTNSPAWAFCGVKKRVFDRGNSISLNYSNTKLK